MNEETSDNVMAYTGKCIVEGASSDKDFTDEKIAKTNRL